MPIDESTWEQATEQNSTATQLLEFLRTNESEAYTTNELVAETVPDDSVAESVVAYYRAILEALVREGTVEKRDVSTDADETDRIPYFRASENEWDDESATKQTQTTREVPLDRPLRVRMADESGPIPVRIEESGLETDVETSPDTDTPFFVRWYHWYRRTWRRAARETRTESNE